MAISTVTLPSPFPPPLSAEHETNIPALVRDFLNYKAAARRSM